MSILDQRSGLVDWDIPDPVSLDIYRFSLHLPVSITYLIPGIVMDVSAIFVAKIHFRIPFGTAENIELC